MDRRVMRASKGEWFSLNWDLSDYADPICFEQYDSCPRFLYAEEDSAQIESEIINKFDRIRLTSISLTEIFIESSEGVKLPTHYREGEFMPGDRPSYDDWLKKYHRVNFYIAERVKDKERINQKNIYLDYTARILRHDMHSGINTYIPRGIKSLKRKLPDEVVKKHSLGGALKMLEEGLKHTQKVYSGVLSFTNLVRESENIDIKSYNINEILNEYLESSAYKYNVTLGDIGSFNVDKTLFCIAIGNLIQGGLTFNNSDNKFVKIYSEGSKIFVEDNGVGLSKEDFILYCKPYKLGVTSKYTGLTLNIAVSIIERHGFSIEPRKIDTGTIFEIDTNLEKNKSIKVTL